MFIGGGNFAFAAWSGANFYLVATTAGTGSIPRDTNSDFHFTETETYKYDLTIDVSNMEENSDIYFRVFRDGTDGNGNALEDMQAYEDGSVIGAEGYTITSECYGHTTGFKIPYNAAYKAYHIRVYHDYDDPHITIEGLETASGTPFYVTTSSHPTTNPTAPTTSQSDVFVVFSEIYGKTSLTDATSGWAYSGCTFTSQTAFNVDNHNVIKVTGTGINGRTVSPDNPTTGISEDDWIKISHGYVAIWPKTATKGVMFSDQNYGFADKRADFTVKPGQWNYLELTFPVQNNYVAFVLSDDEGNAETEFYFDHFYFTKQNISVATTPTKDQNDVLVVFSPTYGKSSDMDQNPGWGVDGCPQTTLYTVVPITIDNGGNKIVKVWGTGYSGRLVNPNDNYAAKAATDDYNMAHVAIWPTTATKGRIFQDGGYTSVYTDFSGLTPGQWNYVDVPVNFTKNYILVYLTQNDGTPETLFYLDHFYLSKETFPTVIEQTKPAIEVKSIYGSFYTPSTTATKANWWDGSTSMEYSLTDSNNKSLKLLKNLDFIGYQYSEGVDITDMKYLHLEVYPLKNMSQISVDVITGNTSPYTDAYYTKRELTANEWNSIDIPLEELSLRTDEGHIYTHQLKITKDGATLFGGDADCYISNIYYWTDNQILDVLEATATTTLAKGATTTITATPKDQNGDNFAGATITYESSNTGIVTVSSSGAVMAKNVGTATVTVTATANGISKSTTLDFTVVMPEPVAPTAAQENVLVVFSETYGKSDAPTAINSGWGKDNVPADPIFTSYSVETIENGHHVLHMVGSTSNGRPLDPNNGLAVKAMTGYGIAHAAVWPTTATKGRIFEDNNYSTVYADFSGLVPGQWNYINVPVNFTKDYVLIYLSQDDGTPETEFYLDHFYLSQDLIAPVLNSASVVTTDAVSATLSMKATDEAASTINYTIAVTKDGEDTATNYTTTGTNAANLTYKVSGLDINTSYTAVVTANDGANNSESITLTFTTSTIPPATAPTVGNRKDIYINGATGEHMNTFEVNAGSQSDLLVATGDYVKYATAATQITITHHSDNEIKSTEGFTTGNFCVYPTGNTTSITVYLDFYSSATPSASATFDVTPGQWNYITYRIADFNDDYAGTPLYRMRLQQDNANPLFFDNFYYVSNNDVEAPVYAYHTTSAAASYIVFTLNYTDNTTDGDLVYKIWNEWGGYEGDVTKKQGENVKFRINSLDPGTTYNYTLKVYDQANNESVTKALTATTPTVTGDLRVNDAPNDPEADRLKAAGMVYITGIWDKDKFIEIDQDYCATAYDLTEVDFRATGNDRLDRDYAYFTFNPNAILVSPKLNKFNINYVMYDRDGETLYGYNFDMIDGDFPAETFYSGNPLYSTVIAPGIANGKYTSGMDASKYLKLDPFTGFKKIVTGQNFAFSRNLNNGDNKGNDVFATVILPFAVDVNNSGVQGSDAPLTLYELSSAVADEDNNITLKFEEVTGVGETNKPYLVKSNIDNGGGTIYFIDSNVPKTLTFPEGNLEAMKRVGAPTEDNATLFGTYVTHEATSNGTEWEGYNGWYHTGIYGLAGGNTSLTLQEMAATTTSGSIIPAWRSMVQLSDVAPGAKISLVFIDHEDEPSDPENPETPEVNPGEGETTAITRPATDSEINAVIGNVYSIDGRKVSSRGNSFMQLPAGIYIVNGKKVIVK